MRFPTASKWPFQNPGNRPIWNCHLRALRSATHAQLRPSNARWYARSLVRFSPVQKRLRTAAIMHVKPPFRIFSFGAIGHLLKQGRQEVFQPSDDYYLWGIHQTIRMIHIAPQIQTFQETAHKSGLPNPQLLTRAQWFHNARNCQPAKCYKCLREVRLALLGAGQTHQLKPTLTVTTTLPDANRGFPR